MITNDQVLTMNLREILKGIVRDEMEQIPELLQELEPRERLNVICKLMPFVCPKVDTVSSSSGEPFNVVY